MGWEKGRYYTRSKKVNGRVVREYVGKGVIGDLASQIDELERADRQKEALAWKHEKEQLEERDGQLTKLIQLAELLARAALLSAGYHQHNRSEWRRKRHGKPSDNRSSGIVQDMEGN